MSRPPSQPGLLDLLAEPTGNASNTKDLFDPHTLEVLRATGSPLFPEEEHEEEEEEEDAFIVPSAARVRASRRAAASECRNAAEQDKPLWNEVSEHPGATSYAGECELFTASQDDISTDPSGLRPSRDAGNQEDSQGPRPRALQASDLQYRKTGKRSNAKPQMCIVRRTGSLQDDTGDRGFLVARKRDRQPRRVLLEQRECDDAPPPDTAEDDTPTGRTPRELRFMPNSIGTSSSETSRGGYHGEQQPATAAPQESQENQTAEGAPKPRIHRRLPRCLRRPQDNSNAECIDQWESTPGMPFEWICIGFKEIAVEEEEEASTCDDDGQEEESDCGEDLDSFGAEVIIGYRPDVWPGTGLPEEDSDNPDEYALDDKDGKGQLEGDRSADDLNPETEVSAMSAVIRSEPSMVSSLPKVSHIILVVHGMGATKEALERNVRDLTASLSEMQKYWFWHVGVHVHVEMIDWKCVLSQLQSTIFDKITPAEARSTRMSLNSTLSDVIFYKTAHYRSKIHAIVLQKMNACLRQVRSDRTGCFQNARVSVIGHSLGSVIAYDVLSGLANADGEGTGLEFEVENFFLWGSPLAAFVSIADIEHQSGKFTLPSRLNTYNLFHPHDPVAFRLEPLFYHTVEQVPPEVLPHWVNNGIRPNKQWAQNYEYAKGLAHQKWTSLKSSLWEAVGKSNQGDLNRIKWDNYLNEDKDLPDFLGTEGARGSDEERKHTGEATLLKPKMRIDFALQEGTVESYVESYGLLQSHFCYWTSRDVGLFILKKISQQETAEMNSFEREQKEAAALAAEANSEGKDGSTSQSGRDGTVALSSRPLSLLTGLPDRDALVRRLGTVPCMSRGDEIENADEEPYDIAQNLTVETY